MISNVYCSVSCTDNSVFLKEKNGIEAIFSCLFNCPAGHSVLKCTEVTVLGFFPYFSLCLKCLTIKKTQLDNVEHGV